MNEKTCSGAASVDQFTGGLFGSLLKKIFGPNGQLWLRRLKKFDRREDPFIRAQEIGRVAEIDPTQSLDGLLRRLGDIGVSISPETWEPLLPDIREVAARRPYESTSAGKMFFSVRLGDLMTMEKAATCTYEDIVRALAEEGFALCDYWSGVSALEMVAGYYRSLPPDYRAVPSLVSFVLIADPFRVGESERFHSGRLMQLSVWLTRDRDQNDSGRGAWAHLTPHAVDAPLFQTPDGRQIEITPHHPLRDLDSRLVCLAMDD